MFGEGYEHHHVHPAGEPHIPGVTHDTVLRPVGATLVAFGALWLLFARMAAAAGDFTEVKLSVAMILGGLLLSAIGKREQQI